MYAIHVACSSIVSLLILGSEGSSLPEFRGLWMATVSNMDWPKDRTSEPATQQKELISYLDTMADTNLNALIIQVRPEGDAFYNSSIEPWSAFLTGKQGRAPTPPWDPLKFAIEEARKRGIETHAWLNPFIANGRPDWKGLAPNHMAVKFKEYAYPYGHFLWMDPAAPEVQNQMLMVVADLMERYSIDGIHIDDFFYPYPIKGVDFPDSKTYTAYKKRGGKLGLSDWRRYNINCLISALYQKTRSKGSVKFSISPFGLYRPGEPEGMPAPIAGYDPYSESYADAKLWLQKGWVDFLVPQIYWSIEAANQSFPMVLDWWLEHNILKRPICAGLAAYRMVETGWHAMEIVKEIEVSQRKRSERSVGNVLFSASDIGQNVKGIDDLLKGMVYPNKVPPF